MVYGNVEEGRFLQRPNRFIAHVKVGEETVIAHVKNTGRCKELLIPGTTVFLEHHPHSSRKTDYSLIAVQKGELLINMDSQAPNKVIEEALAAGWLPPNMKGKVTALRREFTWGDSRFDFGFLLDGTQALLEVKGVTLEEKGRALFPDAPTERGVKHLQHLIKAKQEGLDAAVVFLIQMDKIDVFSPNDQTYPAFGEALRQAADCGVSVSAWSSKVTPDSIVLGCPVPVELSC
ncbi:MAG TPA: DNA/RNA nuclease SfsA [Clostridiales bacterium]|nr:DNA/RNA nuclease SfsA [Clostridiales bacterium]